MALDRLIWSSRYSYRLSDGIGRKGFRPIEYDRLRAVIGYGRWSITGLDAQQMGGQIRFLVYPSPTARKSICDDGTKGPLRGWAKGSGKTGRDCRGKGVRPTGWEDFDRSYNG